MASDKPLVLVLGATGRTGTSIVRGLLESGKFRVAGLIRSESLTKPRAEALRSSGVDVRVGDLTDTPDKLKAALQGVNIVISATNAWVLDAQRDIFRVAKEVGVERVIPCDWATPGAKGVRMLTDTKLAIHDYIKELGLGYTFIDVGWWMQLYLPLPLRTSASSQHQAMTHSMHGSSDMPNLLTDLQHIGTYVARIVADPRTLNQAVIVWEDEVTQKEAMEIGLRLSGDGDALKAKFAQVSAEDLLHAAEEGKAVAAKDPTDVMGHMKIAWAQYMYSMHILGENTLENAKRIGYLDARELYPDIPKYTFEEYAPAFYSLAEPGNAWDM